MYNRLDMDECCCVSYFKTNKNEKKLFYRKLIITCQNEQNVLVFSGKKERP